MESRGGADTRHGGAAPVTMVPFFVFETLGVAPNKTTRNYTYKYAGFHSGGAPIGSATGGSSTYIDVDPSATVLCSHRLGLSRAVIMLDDPPRVPTDTR